MPRRFPVSVLTKVKATAAPPPTVLSPTSSKVADVLKVLEPKCAVALSEFKEEIIAARLQGMTYKEIEALTASLGGRDRVIPRATLHRNLNTAIKRAELPLATELAEERGLELEKFDATRELQAQILVQRERINALTKREYEKRKTSDGYLDPRLTEEMALLNEMIRTLRTIKPEELKGEERKGRVMTIPDKSMEALAELILSGKMEIVALEEQSDEGQVYH